MAIRQPVPLSELREQHAEWMRTFSQAAEKWVEAKAAGRPQGELDKIDRDQREAERHTRRLERRIKRRRTA